MNRIKELREKNGMKQKQLAKILGVESPAVSKYESEKAPLTAAINRLASAIENAAGKRDEELLNSEAFQKAVRKAADKAIDDTLEAMTKSMCSINQIFASRTKNLFDQPNQK